MLSKKPNKSVQNAIKKITEEHLQEEHLSSILGAAMIERPLLSYHDISHRTIEELEEENRYLKKLGNILIKEIREMQRCKANS